MYLISFCYLIAKTLNTFLILETLLCVLRCFINVVSSLDFEVCLRAEILALRIPQCRYH